MTSNESDIQLAVQAINKAQIQSSRRAAATYSIPEATLRHRRAGRPARRDCQPNSKKLTQVEEEAIIKRILDLDERGFAPNLATIREMADRLLSQRGGQPVGVHWARNFVKRTDSLTTRFNRPYDRQRALCEDPVAIGRWFERVEQQRARYGIVDEDVYNFDESGFMMGKITTQLVVTASERRGRPKAVQPGDREWVTVIQGINAAGWAIPPFLIFAGTYHLSAWYEEEAIPQDWVLAVSDNGWTTNVLAMDWLRHFNQYTAPRAVGRYRLLTLDGHESHLSDEFEQYCEQNRIITICMEPHSSHLCQALDVGCFSPLKRAYSREVEQLIRCHINHITKLEFLPAFKQAYSQAFTPANIRSSFRATGLVPHNPEAVLSRLDVQLRTRTPTPASLPDAFWEPKTPSNAHEFNAQSLLLTERVRRHKSSSPASIVAMVTQLQKGAEMAIHTAVLMREQIASLEKAVEAATTRRQRKRKRIQRQGALTIRQGLDLVSQQAVEAQLQREQRVRSGQSGPSRQALARCKRCREPGHNSRTCQKATLDATLSTI